jgi:crossover junction endodeoxyribonuclease RuvC
MVVHLLRLEAAPTPADATDALALAICQVWRGPAATRIDEALARTSRLRESQVRLAAARLALTRAASSAGKRAAR